MAFYADDTIVNGELTSLEQTLDLRQSSGLCALEPAALEGGNNYLAQVVRWDSRWDMGVKRVERGGSGSFHNCWAR